MHLPSHISHNILITFTHLPLHIPHANKGIFKSIPVPLQ